MSEDYNSAARRTTAPARISFLALRNALRPIKLFPEHLQRQSVLPRHRPSQPPAKVLRSGRILKSHLDGQNLELLANALYNAR